MTAGPPVALTDSHCHLASDRFGSDVAEAVDRAVAAGVHRIITLATCHDDLDAHLGLAEKHAPVHCCLGIHPCDVHTLPEGEEAWLAPVAGRLANPQVAAVGETGLDYYHPAPEGWDEEAYRERQRRSLRLHFELAEAHGLAVVVHTRDRKGHASLEDALEIAAPFAGRVRPLFHCFPAGPDQAARVLEIGGFLSFGGILTFPRAETPRAAAAAAPAGRVMVETDSPYLAPVPHRGKRNEPAFVTHTAAELASLRGESLANLSAHTEEAVEACFRL